MKDTFDLYTREWVVVKRRYRKRPIFDTIEGRKTELNRCGTIDVSYEIDSLGPSGGGRQSPTKTFEATPEAALQQSGAQPPNDSKSPGSLFKSADSLSPSEAERLQEQFLQYDANACERKAFDDRRHPEQRARLILTANCAEGELKGSEQPPVDTEPFTQTL